MCRATDEFNLSQTSLTSQAALTALRELPITNPELHAQLSHTHEQCFPSDTDPTAPELEPDFSDNLDMLDDGLYDDGSDIPTSDIISFTVAGKKNVNKLFLVNDDGNIERSAAVENAEVESEVVPEGEIAAASSAVRGKGLRKKIKTRPFGGTGWDWEGLD